MNTKKLSFVNLFLGFCLLLLSSNVKAHQADASSTMLVEQNGKWLFQITAALSAFEYEVMVHNPKKEYKTPEEFQLMVLELVKSQTLIVVNKKDTIRLIDGVVKLGHETKVVFEVTRAPIVFENILIKNTCFKDIRHNQSALVVLKEGVDKKQFVLNNDNDHTQYLRLVEGQWVAVQMVAGSNTKYYLITLSLVVLLVIFGLNLRRYKK